MSNCNPSMTKAGLLKRLNEVSFAVNDIHLFLDTHPCNEKALAFFQEVSEERNRLLKEYASSFGPLTIDTAACSREDMWNWTIQPFPWEQEGGCRSSMWNYEKRLQYPVNITQPNAKLAQFIMSQYGGANIRKT